MISVKNLSTLVGKQVVDQYCNIGKITIIDHGDTSYPIKVLFDDWREQWFTEQGVLAGGDHCYNITLLDDSIILGLVISETIEKYNITPEELISFILEKHC